jgi:hypothetical protein
MAGAGMVGMAVGDHGTLHWAYRIDVETAGPATQPGSNGHQDVLWAHVGYIGRMAAIFTPHAPFPIEPGTGNDKL